MSLESQRGCDPKNLSIHHDPAGYLSTRTIVALATPVGGAISVIRLSGSEAFSILNEMISKPATRDDHRRARRSWITLNGQRVDDAVILPFFGPESFTGEDVIEISTHGSPRISEKILEFCFSKGARLALPGEFSFRAVKNGKMNLHQAEAINELVRAESDLALDLALEKMSGSQLRVVKGIQDEMLTLLTLAEAGIDFSDQDLDEVSLPNLQKRALKLKQEVAQLKGSYERGQKLNEGLDLAFIGLPNAGKSSLFNALLGEDRSIVSSIAGTTRDVVREKIRLKNADGQVVLFRVSDTAGLRTTQDEIEAIGMERTLKSAEKADFVVIVLDGQNPNEEEVYEQVKPLIERGLSRDRWIIVQTKQDLGSRKGLRLFESQHFVSAVTLSGIEELGQDLAQKGSQVFSRKSGEVLLTDVRHVKAAEECEFLLDEALRATDIVLFATELKHARNALAPLIGIVDVDDILGKIFSDFCIGK